MRVLLAWELGSNWGHLATLLPLAQRLRARGHEVVFSIRGLDGDLSLLTSAGFKYLAMPVAMMPLQTLHKQPVRGYADVLALGGFADARTLAQLVQAWLGILHFVNPDVVVCKYAPLAEFGTRDRPVITVGTGFEMPPLTSPLPTYGLRPQKDFDDLLEVENGIFEAINAESVQKKLPAVESVADCFAHVRRFVLTYPELDHFGARKQLQYLGAAESLPTPRATSSAERAFFASASAPITFAYLRLGFVWLSEFLRIWNLQVAPAHLIVVDPSLPSAECKSLSGKFCLVLHEPIDINTRSSVLGTVICHAGHGMVSGALSNGQRLLMMPQYLEQKMMAQRVIQSQPSAAGVALITAPFKPEQVVEVHAALLAMDKPTTVLAYFADPIAEVVRHIEALHGKAIGGISVHTGISRPPDSL